MKFLHFIIILSTLFAILSFILYARYGYVGSEISTAFSSSHYSSDEKYLYGKPNQWGFDDPDYKKSAMDFLKHVCFQHCIDNPDTSPLTPEFCLDLENDKQRRYMQIKRYGAKGSTPVHAGLVFHHKALGLNFHVELGTVLDGRGKSLIIHKVTNASMEGYNEKKCVRLTVQTLIDVISETMVEMGPEYVLWDRNCITFVNALVKNLEELDHLNLSVETFGKGDPYEEVTECY